MNHKYILFFIFPFSFAMPSYVEESAESTSSPGVTLTSEVVGSSTDHQERKSKPIYHCFLHNKPVCDFAARDKCKCIDRPLELILDDEGNDQFFRCHHSECLEKKKEQHKAVKRAQKRYKQALKNQSKEDVEHSSEH